MKSNIKYNLITLLLLVAISINIVFISYQSSSTVSAGEQDEETPVTTDPTCDDVTNNDDYEEVALPSITSFRSALAAYTYAQNLYGETKNMVVSGSGSVSAAGGLANQEIRTIRKFDDKGNIFCESVSKKTSMFGVNFAECSYFKGGSTLKYNESTDISDSLVANYSGTFREVTLDEYKQKNKLLPWERCYVINKDTIEQSNITFNGKVFKCSLVLNNEAVVDYSQKIKNSSGASSLPNFTNVSISFTIDIKGRFLTFTSSDAYTISMGLNASVTQKLTENYSYKKVTIDEV